MGPLDGPHSLSPHPGPLPRGEGESSAVVGQSVAGGELAKLKVKSLSSRKWRIGFGTVVAAILTLWLVIHIFRAKEPTYQGRTLTEWLCDCSVYPPFGWGEIPRAFNPRVPATKHAVKEIGTNAIPVLLDMLQAGDSTTSLKIRLNLPLARRAIIHCSSR